MVRSIAHAPAVGVGRPGKEGRGVEPRRRTAGDNRGLYSRRNGMRHRVLQGIGLWLAIATTFVGVTLLVVPPALAVGAGDHLKCYEVTDSHRSKRSHHIVETKFAVEDPCTVVERAKLFCTPAKKDNSVTEPVLQRHYLCYKIKCDPADRNDITGVVTDQFGRHDIVTGVEQLLCAPVTDPIP